MRTDRQNKIYLELKNLLISLQSTATPDERKYLKKAKISIDESKDFNRSINALNWNLKKIKMRQSGLSSMVNDFYEKTTMIYGEPREDPQYIHWTDRDPDPNINFRGGGRSGGWSDERDEKKVQKNFLFYWLLYLFIGIVVLILFLVSVYSSILDNLKTSLGNPLFYVLCLSTVIILMIVLAITGRIKKK